MASSPHSHRTPNTTASMLHGGSLHTWRRVVVAVVVVLMMCGVQAQTTSACPGRCDCKEVTGGLLVHCRYMRLSALPADMPENTVELDFGYNNLTQITSSTFSNLPQLRKLVLDHSNVQSLADGAFSGLSAVENITLTNNNIATIHPTAFRGATTLKSIYVENNKIPRLPDNVFSGLNLVDLFLENNNLDALTENTFAGATVQNLNIKGNNFERITAAFLAPLKGSVQSLHIADNEQALIVEPDTFEGMQLEKLDVSNNSIEESEFLAKVNTVILDISDNDFASLDFSSYDNLKSVNSLYVQNLRIEFIEKNMLKPFSGLKHLSLAHNKLVFIRGSVFKNTPDLQSLDLSRNTFIMLSDDFGNYLTKLQKLVLTNGHLMTLSSLWFQPMFNLSHLDLRSNKIQVIPQEMGPIFDRVGVHLYLGGNPFHCNCELSWFRDWMMKHGYQTGADMCHSPTFTYIWNLQAEDFKCNKPLISDIVAPVNITNIPEESDVFLTCTAVGDPAPQMSWTNPAGEIIKVTPSYNRTLYKSVAMWLLKSVDSTDAGNYTCEASNVAGTVSKVVVLTISYNGMTTDAQDFTTEIVDEMFTSLPPSPTTTIKTTVKVVQTTRKHEVMTSPTTQTGDVSTTSAKASPGLVSPTVAVQTTEGLVAGERTTGIYPETTSAEGKMTPKANDGSHVRTLIVAIVLGSLAIVLVIIVITVLLTKTKKVKRKYDVNDWLRNYSEMNSSLPVPNGTGGDQEEKQVLTQI